MPHDGSQDAPVPGAASVLIERQIPADFRWVRRVIHEAEEALAQAGLAAEDIGSLSIVFAEALNNVVEHAVDASSNQNITLKVRRRNTSLMIEIRDNGRPMPKGRAPMGNHPMSGSDKLDSMPEGGYGWFLIREIVQDLVYDRQNDENILFFRYKLTG